MSLLDLYNDIRSFQVTLNDAKTGTNLTLGLNPEAYEVIRGKVGAAAMSSGISPVTGFEMYKVDFTNTLSCDENGNVVILPV